MSTYEHNDDLTNLLDDMDKATTAVLVIDELGPVVGTPLEEVLLRPTLNTAKILDVARGVGVPVIFTNDAHIPGLDKELELWGEHGIAGSPDAQTSVELGQQEGDYEIKKRRYSAFFQTDLLLLLNELGVDSLILCGFDTNICVQHTAADAYFNNFKIAVVTDATATFLVGDQETGLEYMKMCYAARLVNTQEVIDFLEG